LRRLNAGGELSPRKPPIASVNSTGQRDQASGTATAPSSEA
jgi:hypothetical protein